MSVGLPAPLNPPTRTRWKKSGLGAKLMQWVITTITGDRREKEKMEKEKEKERKEKEAKERRKEEKEKEKGRKEAASTVAAPTMPRIAQRRAKEKEKHNRHMGSLEMNHGNNGPMRKKRKEKA